MPSVGAKKKRSEKKCRTLQAQKGPQIMGGKRKEFVLRKEKKNGSTPRKVGTLGGGRGARSPKKNREGEKKPFLGKTEHRASSKRRTPRGVSKKFSTKGGGKRGGCKASVLATLKTTRTDRPGGEYQNDEREGGL